MDLSEGLRTTDYGTTGLDSTEGRRQGGLGLETGTGDFLQEITEVRERERDYATDND